MCATEAGPAPSWLKNSGGRALQRYRSLSFFQAFFTHLVKLRM